MYKVTSVESRPGESTWVHLYHVLFTSDEGAPDIRMVMGFKELDLTTVLSPLSCSYENSGLPYPGWAELVSLAYEKVYEFLFDPLG